ncbi:hypothetical protein C8Q70DRAFT_247397 [Cubamyces menziesii]|uniref:F-box domain-containing protein n=1 Tax=Trametes cubensis TaxID=1111947 RepID=A0AAD7TG74_9APHY|nr:hypothetical protein C8Q70DRAFT_247397 [Cubamyces menziesii]KAJ8455808.1 hypothetical protein ONZ51_g12327 [Trametes cubensis]
MLSTSPPLLPVEVIEHALTFLQDNLPALARCSLVCRGFLHTCRSLVWRDVDLNFGSFKLRDRLAKLSEVLVLHPDLGYLVRCFTISCARRSELSVEGAIRLCRLFPSLRSLRLFGVDYDSLPMLFRLIRSVPTLEALYLFNIRDHGIDSSVPLLLPCLPSLPYITLPLESGLGRHNASPQTSLKVLSIVGRRRTRHGVFQDITSLLKSSGLETSHLRSLNLRVSSRLESIPGVQVPSSCASHLTHFGIAVRDLITNSTIDRLGREHMRRVFADLPKCGRLRSLCLQYDRPVHCVNRRYPQAGMHGSAAASEQPSASLFFLLELSELLSPLGAPPFPNLESLVLAFLTPPGWLSSCTEALERLAQACLGRSEDDLGERRYPRFTRLEVQMLVPEMVVLRGQKQQAWEARARFAVAGEHVLPMFASFTRAGVQVEISWVGRLYQAEQD